MITAGEQVHFVNRAEWRTWLEKNHVNTKEIWLIQYKRHTGKPGLALVEAIEEALRFG